MGLVSFELTTLFLVQLVAPSKLVGSGAEVRFFAFLILMHKGLYRIASLLLQDYR
jgi:hypothetical protein